MGKNLEIIVFWRDGCSLVGLRSFETSLLMGKNKIFFVSSLIFLFLFRNGMVHSAGFCQRWWSLNTWILVYIHQKSLHPDPILDAVAKYQDGFNHCACFSERGRGVETGHFFPSFRLHGALWRLQVGALKWAFYHPRILILSEPELLGPVGSAARRIFPEPEPIPFRFLATWSSSEIVKFLYCSELRYCTVHCCLER